MRGKQYRHPPLKPFDHIPQLTTGEYIQSHRRLVEEQNLRIGDEAHCDAEPALHATGERVCFLGGHRIESEFIKCLLCARLGLLR